MALYMIGDIQGCDEALQALLQTLDFSPSRDTLFVLGDLVNRGPSSLATMRRLMALGDSAQCLLGNHDLHLLAVGLTGARVKPQDTLDSILGATDRNALLDWLRHRPLAIDAHGWLMVHAGVLPQWTRAQTVALAQSAQAVLRGETHVEFFKNMYGNWPNQWQAPSARTPEWTAFDETRLVINALTRIRLCDSDGQLDFAYKGDATGAPAGLMPWYAVPGRRTADTRIAFGHWSTLRAPESGLFEPPMVLPLDTGCVWGGCLTAAEFRSDSAQVTLIKQPCPQAQQPG
jgi:bis(5'-nucleosyl)-tetraphosphatase (symmetrical)